MANIMLASAGGPTITIWENLRQEDEKYSLLQQISPSVSTVSSICWSPNGQFLASSTSNEPKITLCRCDDTGFKSVTLVPEIVQPYVRFSNTNTRYLITCGSDSYVSIWDLKTRKVMKRLNTYLNDGITCVAYNRGDTHIASGGENGTVVLTNVVSGISLSPMVPTYANPQAISAMQFSSMQKNLLGTVLDDGSCILWDCNTRKQKHSFTHVHVAPATGIAFSPVNEMLFITTGLDKSFLFHDSQSNKTISEIKTGAFLTSVDFSPNGSFIAAGTYKGSILIYDIRQCTLPVTVIEAHQSAITALNFRKAVPVTKSEAFLTSEVPMPNKTRKLKRTPSTSVVDQTALNHINASLANSISPVILCETNLIESSLKSVPDSTLAKNMAGDSTNIDAEASARADVSIVHNIPNILLELKNNINGRMDVMESEIKDIKNQVVEIKELIKLQMDKLHERLHIEISNLNTNVIKGFHDQEESIEEMLGYRTLASDLHSEVQELKREINNLKKHY